MLFEDLDAERICLQSIQVLVELTNRFELPENFDEAQPLPGSGFRAGSERPDGQIDGGFDNGDAVLGPGRGDQLVVVDRADFDVVLFAATAAMLEIGGNLGGVIAIKKCGAFRSTEKQKSEAVIGRDRLAPLAEAMLDVVDQRRVDAAFVPAILVTA